MLLQPFLHIDFCSSVPVMELQPLMHCSTFIPPPKLEDEDFMILHVQFPAVQLNSAQSGQFGCVPQVPLPPLDPPCMLLLDDEVVDFMLVHVQFPDVQLNEAQSGQAGCVSQVPLPPLDPPCMLLLWDVPMFAHPDSQVVLYWAHCSADVPDEHVMLAQPLMQLCTGSDWASVDRT